MKYKYILNTGMNFTSSEMLKLKLLETEKKNFPGYSALKGINIFYVFPFSPAKHVHLPFFFDENFKKFH